MLVEYIVSINSKLHKGQDALQNPTMIQHPDERKFVVFTATTEECTYPTIFFHELRVNKITWEIYGGLQLINFVPDEDSSKPFDVYYLTD